MPNKPFRVSRTVSPNNAQEVELGEYSTLRAARIIALEAARQHKGCRITVDKQDVRGCFVREVEAHFIAPARA